MDYPTKSLDLLHTSVLVPHRLDLEAEIPIYLVERFGITKTARGTFGRKQTMLQVIKATIVSKYASGEDIFILSITFISS